MKRALYISVITLLLVSCNNDFAVEDQLYKCLKEEFAKNSLNLDHTLDTLETLYIKEGLIESNNSSDYRQYYQRNIDSGRILSLKDDYSRKLALRVQWSHLSLDSCALKRFDKTEFEKSRYGRITNMIDSLVNATGQISSSTVAKSHLQVLSPQDFNHPFYRANILLSLQFNYFNKYLDQDAAYIKNIPKN